VAGLSLGKLDIGSSPEWRHLHLRGAHRRETAPTAWPKIGRTPWPMMWSNPKSAVCGRARY